MLELLLAFAAIIVAAPLWVCSVHLRRAADALEKANEVTIQPMPGQAFSARPAGIPPAFTGKKRPPTGDA